jgi:hypothetical protein
MTGKKKVIDQKLKGLIKNFQRRTEATSQLNDRGDLIQRKHYGTSSFDIEGGISDANQIDQARDSQQELKNKTVISAQRLYELQTIADSVPDEHATSIKYRSKKYKSPTIKKRTIKKCRCK